MTVLGKQAACSIGPAVIVHGLEMARLVVAEAASARVTATLLSAPGAGAYAGVGWWQALVALAGPEGGMADILDCGEAPGRALQALRAGQRLVVLRAQPGLWADIAGRATASGATLLAEAPTALDLGVRGATRHLPAWLRGEPIIIGPEDTAIRHENPLADPGASTTPLP